MKILTAIMLILFLFSAQADEAVQWELVIITDDHLYPTRVPFDQKKICTEVGLAWVKADSKLEGFVCDDEPTEWIEPEGEGS